MRPFFCFYGGKWRSAPHYQQPEFPLIIEPFAGAAGYSTRHYKHDILLVEKDIKIYLLWDFLINAEKKDILLKYVLIGIAIQIVWYIIAPIDDSDQGRLKRSGLSIVTDAKTNQQYLTTPQGGIIERKSE